MIEQTTFEGIPTLLTPGDGPARGGISFRVGHADETLARAGITHLIEHLALHRLGLTDYHYNGATGATVTHFFSQGSTEDVGEYLTNVCAALGDLPMDRLEMEKEILNTEAAGKSRSVSEQLLLWRHGARSYGVSAYPEWGLPALTPEHLRDWVSRYFTRDNAVLWFSGTVPATLRVALPGGIRAKLPEPTSALPTTPAWFAGAPRGVALHTVVDRSPAAQVYAGVLERELFRALRQEGGFSYTAAAAYEPVDTRTATIVAVADAHQDKQDAALGGFVDVVSRLRWGSIDQRDIDATLAKARESMKDPDVDETRLPAAAFGLLIGSPLLQTEELLRQVESVTAADLKPVAEQAAANALLMVPEGRRADWAGYTAAPNTSADAVPGKAFPMHGNSEQNLVVDSTGVSITTPAGAATVRFADLAVMLAWPDGGRLLIGNDGISCRVEPTLYAVEQAALSVIDAGAPADLVVRLPARVPDSIPQPPRAETLSKPLVNAKKNQKIGTSTGTPLGKEPAKVLSKPGKALMVAGKVVTLYNLVLAGGAALVFAIASVVGTFQAFLDPRTEEADLGTTIAIVVVLWGVTALLITRFVVSLRRRNR